MAFSNITHNIIGAARIIGTGIATTGLTGAGIGIGVVSRALILNINHKNKTLYENYVVKLVSINYRIFINKKREFKII